MIIVLNGVEIEVDDGSSLDDAVISLGKGRGGNAAAINGEIIPRSHWNETLLATNDQIEILGAAPGG